MSFAKHGITNQSVELGKTVLLLSALGLFTKLLHIDLSHLQVLGIALQPKNAGLIPGFLGLTLMYTYMAFFVSRMEAVIETQVDSAVTESRNRVLESKLLLTLTFLVLPFSFVVYSLPFFIGALAIIFLWSDSILVLQAIWSLAAI